MARKGQKFHSHDDYKLKAIIINEKLKEGKSYSFLEKKYGISRGTLMTWVYQYKHKDKKIMKEKRGKNRKDENENYKEKYEILKKYIDFLGEVDQGKK